MGQQLVSAIILIPAALPLDGEHARLAMAHVERRGYHLFSVLRNWDAALKVLGAQAATVVVFADREHIDPTWEPRVEVVGEETRRIVAGKPLRALTDDTSGRRPQRLG